MSLSTLLSHLSGLSPQARYALMKLWLENRDSFPLRLSVQDCARDLAMPRARAGKVINELIEKGHIEPDYSFGQRGRPKRFIDISAATKGMLSKLTPTQTGEVLHLESVHRLLNHRTSDTASDSPSLSPANLVFLIALLSCANESGAVHGIGTTRLSTYTGMSAQRINLQIREIKKLGLILVSVPGMTGAHILGKTTTSYWLNLSHPLFKLPTGSTLVEKVIVALESGATANAMFDITHQMKVIKREHRKTSEKPLDDQQAFDHLAITELNARMIGQIPDFDISLVEGFFREAANLNLRLAFQVVVDRVARFITLARIKTSSNSSQIALTLSMLRTLYRELLPRRFLSTSSEASPSKESRRMLVMVVLEIANTLAREIVTELRGNGFKLSSVTSVELAPISKASTDRLLVVALDSPDPRSTKKEKTAN